MEESFTSLPTSHLLGSVPAVISDGKDTINQVPEANLQIFPPNSGGGRGRGYQTIGPSEPDAQQPTANFTNNWKGVFSVLSYTQFFNVDTDIVVDRLMSSFYPTGNFFSKIDANPDLYGLVWICTTLVFLIASFGNCATYLMKKRNDSATSWNFDVNYVNLAAGSLYGYAVIVPLGFYFLLQYLGSNAKLVHFWCMWGYSLFIFVPCSFLLLIPVEFIRWIIILITGAASAAFVASNLKTYVEGNDLTIVLVASFVLQIGLAIFIKVMFFP
jgi:hypothetical protein